MLASPTGFGAYAFVKLAALCALTCGAANLIAPARAHAQVAAISQSSPMIFDVRKSLPLEPQEPTFHDFYINAGPDAGFRKGQYILVVRQVPVHDPVLNKQQGTLNVNVARLQVIQVERSLTVARLVAEFSDEERPTLEYEAVMIGDRIDTSSMTMEAPSLKKKKVLGKQADAGAPVAPAISASSSQASPTSSQTSAPNAATNAAPNNVPDVAPAASERSVQPIGAPPSVPSLGPSKTTSTPLETQAPAFQTVAVQTTTKALPASSDADMVRVLDLTDWPPAY